MGLLDGRADLAVSDAHWGFWEVVAELVKSARKEKVGLGDSVGGCGWFAYLFRLLCILLWCPTVLYTFLSHTLPSGLHCEKQKPNFKQSTIESLKVFSEQIPCISQTHNCKNPRRKRNCFTKVQMYTVSRVCVLLWGEPLTVWDLNVSDLHNA